MYEGESRRMDYIIFSEHCQYSYLKFGACFTGILFRYPSVKAYTDLLIRTKGMSGSALLWPHNEITFLLSFVTP